MFRGIALILLFCVSGKETAARIFSCSIYLRSTYQEFTSPNIPQSLQKIKHAHGVRWYFDEAYRGSVLEESTENNILAGMYVYYTPGHIYLSHINEITLDYLLSGSLKNRFDIKHQPNGFILIAKDHDKVATEQEFFAKIENDLAFLYEAETERRFRTYPRLVSKLFKKNFSSLDERKKQMKKLAAQVAQEDLHQAYKFLLSYTSFDHLMWDRDLLRFRRKFPFSSIGSRSYYLDTDNGFLNLYLLLKAHDKERSTSMAMQIRSFWLNEIDFVTHASVELLQILLTDAITETNIDHDLIGSVFQLRPQLVYANVDVFDKIIDRLLLLSLTGSTDYQQILLQFIFLAIENSASFEPGEITSLLQRTHDFAIRNFSDSVFETKLELVLGLWRVVELGEKVKTYEKLDLWPFFEGYADSKKLFVVLERQGEKDYKFSLKPRSDIAVLPNTKLSRYDYYLMLSKWPQSSATLVLGTFEDFIAAVGEPIDLATDLQEILLK